MDSIIELRHLKTLLALEETGSVSLAAKRVFLTQSALSHQIRALENYYDTPLFERKSTPLRFTPAGERVRVFGWRRPHWWGRLRVLRWLSMEKN